ncbi:hypothetical protein RYX36_021040 [Vicia faba]
MYEWMSVGTVVAADSVKKGERRIVTVRFETVVDEYGGTMRLKRSDASREEQRLDSGIEMEVTIDDG